MRFLRSVKGVALIVLAVLCALFGCLLRRLPVFEEGECYEFYRGTSSAEIVPSDFPVRDKLLLGPVRGESVRYAGDRAEELIGRFRATLLFTEEAAGVVNYYLYSPALGEAVLLRGMPVNLHIAVSERGTAAGTPLIFGGF